MITLRDLRSLLSSLGVKPQARLVLRPRHHSFYASGAQGRKHVFFKILLTSDRSARRNFLTELRALQFFHQTSSLPFQALDVLATGAFQGRPWVLRSYINGDGVGTRLTMSPRFIRVPIRRWITLFERLQRQTPKAIAWFRQHRLPLQTKGGRWMQTGFQQDHSFSAYFATFKKTLPAVSLRQLNHSLAKHRPLFDQRLVLTHGDLHGENLILTPHGMTVLDWENLHLHHPLFDAGYFWLNSWEHPNWQNRFESELLRTRSDRRAFTLIKLRWLLRQMGLLHHAIHDQPKNAARIRRLTPVFLSHRASFDRLIDGLSSF